ncbi:MAG TPA: S8 family serine peptidase [Candidatus Acidoferrales bacterium]|nr:S8 family serine peptidase [Candidatus Acidoferrales bacterium]
MKGPLKLVAPLVAALAVAACSAGGSSSMPVSGGALGSQAMHIPQWETNHSAHPACGGSHIGQAQCDVLIENGGAHSMYAGWSAKDLEAAYGLPSATKGKGQKVFIVDAYDNPDVVSDFAVYRKGQGLPVGKIVKYNQSGQQSNYPTNSPGWGVEIDLDVEMASASCPKCEVDLVEANSNAWTDIEASEEEAVKLGATIISNSYDGSGASESAYESKGVTYLASSGDSGLGLYDPATYQHVIAVGGTVLNPSSDKRKYSEVVWTDSGGGCSNTGEAKPAWQKDPDCTFRTGSDIGAVAVNASEYDTDSEGGWITVDGTSISSPLTAGMVALAGNSTKQTGGENLWKLSKKSLKKDIYPVTEGNDGSCGGEYLCTAGTKQFGIYSGPTGWGTPHGVGGL